MRWTACSVPCASITTTHPRPSHFLALKKLTTRNSDLPFWLTNHTSLSVCNIILFHFIRLPEAIASPVRIPFPVDFADFNPPGRIIVQSYVRVRVIVCVSDSCASVQWSPCDLIYRVFQIRLCVRCMYVVQECDRTSSLDSHGQSVSSCRRTMLVYVCRSLSALFFSTIMLSKREYTWWLTADFVFPHPTLTNYEENRYEVSTDRELQVHAFHVMGCMACELWGNLTGVELCGDNRNSYRQTCQCYSPRDEDDSLDS